MRNNEDDLFMSRKKNPSFTEWTLQNGIVNPQSKKPAATNVGGGVPDDPHSQTNQWVTSRTTTSTQTQTDPFLEGFYSVADKPETERKTYLQHREKTEAERPKTNSAYQRATPYDSNLKIIGNNVTEKDYEDFITALQNERTGNKLNWSAGQMKPQSDTKAYWHEGQPWMSPATETDDYRKNAGREYAQNIIDDLFYGDENMFVGAALLPGIPKNVVTPVSKSKYKEIHNRAGYTDANAQYIAGVTSVIDPAINSTKNAIEAKEAIELLGKPILDKIPHISGKKMAVLAGIAQTFMDDSTIPSILNTYNNTYVENSSRKQAKQMLDYLEDSDYKYLADFDESREKYIEDLQKEVEKLEETEQLGYLPPGENEIFKEEAINTLKRIIYLNQQYDRFSKIRDKELSDAARLR